MPAENATPRRLHSMEPGEFDRLAAGHGWVFTRTDGRMFTVRRTWVQATPPRVLCTPEEHSRQPFGRWPEPTYQAHEFLTFSVKGGRVHGRVLYRDATGGPWNGVGEGYISQRRAMEILTVPWGERP